MPSVTAQRIERREVVRARQVVLIGVVACLRLLHPPGLRQRFDRRLQRRVRDLGARLACGHG